MIQATSRLRFFLVKVSMEKFQTGEVYSEGILDSYLQVKTKEKHLHISNTRIMIFNFVSGVLLMGW